MSSGRTQQSTGQASSAVESGAVRSKVIATRGIAEAANTTVITRGTSIATDVSEFGMVEDIECLCPEFE